jgi:aldehyde dehydrogenase (NAD+)
MEMQELFSRHRDRALQLRCSTASERVEKLKKLRSWIEENRQALQEALYLDFQKPQVETDLTEYYLVKAEIDLAIKGISKWMKPKGVKTPLTLIGSRSSILFEPKGVCLIIAPWNYPFSLLVAPLVSAIAAGNTVFLKPSEVTNNTSNLISRMIKTVFDKEEVVAYEGGNEVSTELLKLPFDHIFFTGSSRVGKIIMEAASKNLTSLTLELGGKSPNIIDETADLVDAVEKIVFNKFLNAGQTCIAPDYVMAHSTVYDQFVSLLKNRIEKVYGGNDKDLAGISSIKHFDHLIGLMKNATSKGARIEFGGDYNEEKLRLTPTVLTGISSEMTLMHEEIFGPILPIIKFESLDEAIKFVNERPKPLALYFFSRDNSSIQKVIATTSSGGVCINDGNIQFSNNYLPFGGVNKSGVGRSHGYFGFKTFSNEKAILKQRIGLTSLKVLYPPYTKKVKKYVELLLKWL